MAGMWHNGWSTGGWLLMSLMMIVFWTFVVSAAIWLRKSGQRPLTRRGAVARQILDERFARGELTDDEYKQRRELLNTR